MGKTIVYFDNNIYADIIRQGLNAGLIKSALDKNKSILLISSLNLFEAASCWKSGSQQAIAEGMKRFQLLKDLLPCRFLQEVKAILVGEIDKALNNHSFDVFYDGAEAEVEIGKLASGIYDQTAKAFIEQQWVNKSTEVTQKINHLNQIKVNVVFKDFEEFLSIYQQELAEDIIKARVKGIPDKIARKLAEKMLQKSQKFPFFNSFVKANLYLDFRVLKFNTIRHDALDDAKHLIIASYADVFVTNDEKLHGYFHNINARLMVLRLNEFLAS
jgi:hypothetical protein